MTIESLKEFGADTETGLNRCLGNTDFYLSLVKMALDDQSFSNLAAAIATNNLDSAFEFAHALKGVYGNVALTPVYEPICELTEHLRNKENVDDYNMYINRISSKLNELKQQL
ncbi:MAG: Hpt domain-containing protein [Ruminococcus sp.]|nr:Hpt domain-containing protein [Ruminococcus sp.]